MFCHFPWHNLCNLQLFGLCYFPINFSQTWAIYGLWRKMRNQNLNCRWEKSLKVYIIMSPYNNQIWNCHPHMSANFPFLRCVFASYLNELSKVHGLPQLVGKRLLLSLSQSSFYECTNIWGSMNCAFTEYNIQSLSPCHLFTKTQYCIIPDIILHKRPFSLMAYLKLGLRVSYLSMSKFTLLMDKYMGVKELWLWRIQSIVL